MNTIDSSYQDKHLLGYGFDIVTGATAAAGLEPFATDTNDTRDEYAYFRSITDETEMRQELDVSVKGDYTLDGIDIGVSANYIDQIEASATSMSLVAEYSSMTTGYALAKSGDYKLRKEAEQYFAENGQAAFQERYGHYFIAGHKYGSKFFAVYRCTGSNSKTFREFKTELSASGLEVFEASGAAKFSSLAKSKDVSVEIKIHMVGVPKSVGRPPIKNPTPDEVLGILNWFRQNETGAPIETLFMSYANVLAGYSNKIDVSPELLARLRLVYANFWLMKFLFRSLPGYYEQQYRVVFQRLTSDIEANHSEFMRDGGLIDRFYGETENLIGELQDVFACQALYNQVGDELARTPEPATGIGVEDTRIGLRSYGSTIFDSSMRSFVRIDEEEFSLGAVFFFSAPPTHSFGWENGDRIILGWRIESRRDGLAVWVKDSSGQACLSHQLRLTFTSVFGCSYKISVYSADKDRFRFGDLGEDAKSREARAGRAS